MKLRLRKDKLVSEDNISYIAFGVNVYKGWKRVRIIKDISLRRERLRNFVAKCNLNKIDDRYIDDIVQTFVDDEFKVTEKPCFLK